MGLYGDYMGSRMMVVVMMTMMMMTTTTTATTKLNPTHYSGLHEIA